MSVRERILSFSVLTEKSVHPLTMLFALQFLTFLSVLVASRIMYVFLDGRRVMGE